ncbi:MAG: iron-containing alcohol dehydrogenase [Lentisphaeria bacterium]|nr:iron-containing alcohol dehydrogenase [Lentisphaeria bacterium]
MENFVYYNPVKVNFGKGVIAGLGDKLIKDQIKKVLMVFGGGSIKKNGVYDQVTQSLKSAGISWIEVDGVQPNPTLKKVEEATRMAKENGVDAILAVGGGSVIDTAKTTAAACKYDGKAWDLYTNRSGVEVALPLYTVLTLSATGSEMNEFAVITNEALGLKWSIYGDALFPKATFIDPTVQQSLPWFQTANGAVDAISHIMEQYFSGKYADATMTMAEGLICSIIRSTDELQKDSMNYDARANLAWASSLALNGLFRTGTGMGDWGSHGIEHGMSAVQTEIAHGAGLAVIFPAWILHVGDNETLAFQRWSKNIWNCDSLALAVQELRNKLRRWNHPTTLNELGVKKENINLMIETSLKISVGRVKALNKTDLEQIYILAK